MYDQKGYYRVKEKQVIKLLRSNAPYPLSLYKEPMHDRRQNTIRTGHFTHMTWARTCTHTHTHACTRGHTRAHTHMHINMHTCIYAHTHKCTHTHTCTSTCACTQTHSQTHTFQPSISHRHTHWPYTWRCCKLNWLLGSLCFSPWCAHHFSSQQLLFTHFGPVTRAMVFTTDELVTTFL